jgi:hypothetical protein
MSESADCVRRTLPKLRKLDRQVMQGNDKPQAVLLQYEHFLAMQERIKDDE